MRTIWKWISNFSTAWGLLPSGIAASAATIIWVGLMAVAGYAQSVPLFWIMMGLPLAAASLITLFLRVLELQARQNVKDKLSFATPRTLKKLDKNEKLEGICLGFQVASIAPYPIEFSLEGLDTHLGDNYPPKKPYPKTKFTIPPHGVGWFDDHLIPIKPPNDGVWEGEVRFTIKFGVKNRLRHSLAKKVIVFVGFDDKGDMKGSNWQEA
jgi:hypothetical protein